jgi:hypothetical protein
MVDLSIIDDSVTQWDFMDDQGDIPVMKLGAGEIHSS